ncbi:MAG: TrkH family potassium uptake protein [Muribaculaceae bacterium]|nr:TrkH family potassium uptake protein [Muribaculaceae bacterium]MDE6558311.1 TrkH family potassium uptake protein [Muribaculaceae bacterium]
MLTYKKRSYINFRMVFRVFGWLLLTEAAIMAIPCIVGILYGEGSTINFLICIAITAATGFGLKSLKPKYRDMGQREAILLTGSTWVILSAFGMLPFLLCRTHFSVTDAFFETMSGFTTTGASVLDTLEGVPHSILIWRCIAQWIGGLGIILFTLAIVPMLNTSGGMMLFNAEVTGITHDKLQPRIGNTSKGLWGIYIVLTFMLTILLVCSDMNIFDAVCYGLSTMSTGGFGNSDLSLGKWDSLYIKWVMVVFMFLGGVNFSLLFGLTKGRFKAFLKNDALKCYIWIIVVCYIIFTLNIFFKGIGHSWSDFTIDPLFQAVSILSSTGLTEPDFHDWGAVSVIVLIVMMLMGACAGSTSGGAKIDRFIILIKFLQNEFYRMMHPNAIRTVVINGKGTPAPILMKTLAFLFMYLIVVIVGAVGLMLFGLPLRDGFFCALSAVSNTGLGTDMTGIEGNYSQVSDAAKWLLSFLMLTGRLELYTVLLIFTPGFWKK